MGGMLFALVQLQVFHPTAIAHLTCVFLLLMDDTHIIGHALDMAFNFLWL